MWLCFMRVLADVFDGLCKCRCICVAVCALFVCVCAIDCACGGLSVCVDSSALQWSCVNDIGCWSWSVCVCVCQLVHCCCCVC